MCGMGCWHGTCALTNLPILHRDPVRIVFLRERRDPCGSGVVRSTDFWMPISYAIAGRYDGHGAVEDIDDTTFEVRSFVRWLAPRLVEYPEVGENPYHDLVVSRELASDLHRLQRHIHNAPMRMRIMDALGRSRRATRRRFTPELSLDGAGDLLGYCLFHEAAYQALLDTPLESWDGVRSRRSLSEGSRARFAGYASQIRGCADDPAKTLTVLFWAAQEERGACDFSREIADDLRIQMLEAVRSGAPEIEVGRFSEVDADLTLFCDHMDALRKHWSPQAGAGSQDIGAVSHSALLRVAAEILSRLESPDGET